MFIVKNKSTILLYVTSVLLITSQICITSTNAAAAIVSPQAAQPEGASNALAPVPASNAGSSAVSSQGSPAVSNTEFTDFLATMWKFFQSVQSNNGQAVAGSNCNNNQNIICSILVKNSSSDNFYTAIDYPQPMTVQQCQALCNQTCVAYEITNITTSTRTVYPQTGFNGACNCGGAQSVTNTPVPPENVVEATTTSSTTTSSTTTPTTTTPSTTTTPTTTTSTTPATTVTYAPTAYQVAFTASSSTPFNQVGGTIPLNVVNDDFNGHFNTATNQFAVTANGIYFVDVCTGVQAGNTANVRIQGSTPLQLGLTWDAKSQNGIESPCRSGLVQATHGTSLSLVLDSGEAYSDANNLVSMSVFSVSDTMNADAISKLVYAVAPNSPAYVNNTLTPIPLKTVIAPANPTTFNANIGQYTCQSTGTYIVSVSIGVQTNIPTEVMISTQDISTGLTRTTLKFDGVTSLSRTVVINCNQGNTIQLNLLSGTVVDSDLQNLYNLTTFTVFPYQPSHVANPAAWGIYKWYIAYNNEQGNTGPLDPFYFTNVSVNLGGLYDINSRYLIVQSSGYYYTCLTSGAGVGKDGSSFTFLLQRNNEVLLGVEHSSTSEGATDMYGSCGVVLLKAGDQIRPVGSPNSYFYSSLAAYELSWIGFKLYDV